MKNIYGGTKSLFSEAFGLMHFYTLIAITVSNNNVMNKISSPIEIFCITDKPHNLDCQLNMPLALEPLAQNLLPLQELQVFSLQPPERLLQQVLQLQSLYLYIVRPS